MTGDAVAEASLNEDQSMEFGEGMEDLCMTRRTIHVDKRIDETLRPIERQGSKLLEDRWVSEEMEGERVVNLLAIR